MKIGIIGAGAMGSLYGGVLAEGGHEVWFVDVFEPHIQAVNERGLIIEKEGKPRTIQGIRATSDATQVGPVELAIVFVKSTLTDIAVAGNRALFDENTTVLTLQNGVGNIEKMAQTLDASQIVAGTSANGANSIEPGAIRHAGWGGTAIGELDGRVTPRIERLAKILGTGELGPVSVSENVLGLIWDKLLVNVGINPVTALTRLRNGELLEGADTEHLMETLVREGAAVAEAKGIRLMHTDAVAHCKEVARATAQNISSMLADVLNGRKTEIDNINGAIVREGAALGIATPANETVTALIQGWERTKL